MIRVRVDVEVRVRVSNLIRVRLGSVRVYGHNYG